MSNEIMESNIKENFEITKGADGKFARKAIYKPFSSIEAVTKEEKITMLNLLNSGEIALPMGEHINEKIEIADVIFNPYDKVNEETGDMEYGVLTYIITPDGEAYVTSSKSVYYTLKTAFAVFGEPHYNEEERFTVQIIKKQGQQFKYTDIKIVA